MKSIFEYFKNVPEYTQGLLADNFITEHKFYNIKQSDNLEDNIEVILNLIEKLQKENEEWQRAYQEEKDKQFELLRKIEKMAEEYLTNNPGMAEYLNNNYIHKRKIKDKIEELNNVSNAEELEDIMNRKDYTITELVQYVLQELLERRNK